MLDIKYSLFIKKKKKEKKIAFAFAIENIAIALKYFFS